jgi:hypothetical protein
MVVLVVLILVVAEELLEVIQGMQVALAVQV